MPRSSLVFNVGGITHGHFELVSNPGVPITNFTQAEIAGGLVQFVHDGSGIAPTFSISVSDGTAATGPVIANIVFTALGSGSNPTLQAAARAPPPSRRRSPRRRHPRSPPTNVSNPIAHGFVRGPTEPPVDGGGERRRGPRGHRADHVVRRRSRSGWSPEMQLAPRARRGRRGGVEAAALRDRGRAGPRRDAGDPDAPQPRPRRRGARADRGGPQLGPHQRHCVLDRRDLVGGARGGARREPRSAPRPPGATSTRCRCSAATTRTRRRTTSRRRRTRTARTTSTARPGCSRSGRPRRRPNQGVNCVGHPPKPRETSLPATPETSPFCIPRRWRGINSRDRSPGPDQRSLSAGPKALPSAQCGICPPLRGTFPFRTTASSANFALLSGLQFAPSSRWQQGVNSRVCGPRRRKRWGRRQDTPQSVRGWRSLLRPRLRAFRRPGRPRPKRCSRRPRRPRGARSHPVLAVFGRPPAPAEGRYRHAGRRRSRRLARARRTPPADRVTRPRPSARGAP